MRLVKALYDCQADNEDELTFVAGELIYVTGMEEPGWWVHTSPVLAGRRRPQLRSPAHASLPGGLSLNCCQLLSLGCMLEKQPWNLKLGQEN